MLELRPTWGVLLLLLACTPSLFGQGSFSVSHQYKNTPLLEIIQDWSSSYGIDFTFNPADLGQVRVQSSVEAENLEDAIEQLLGPTLVAYRVVNPQKVLLRFDPNKKPKLSFIQLVGKVIDAETGQHLSYATIFVSGSKFGTTAGQDGSFSLRFPDSLKARQLVCRYLGYKARSIKMGELPSFMSISMEVDERSLDPIQIEDLSHSMVSTMALGAYSFSPQLVPVLPALSQQDPLKAIQYLPGVKASGENLSELSVRGGQRDENLMLLDEIPLFHVDHFLGIFSVFHPDAIRSFQFYQTDFPIQYGGRTSSILAIQGQSGLDQNLRLGLQTDVFSTQSSLSVPIKDKVGLFIAYRRGGSNIGGDFTKQLPEQDAIDRIMQDQLPDTAEAIVRNVPIPQFSFSDLYGRLDIKLSPSTSFSLSLFQSGDRIDYLGDRESNAPPPKQFFDGPRKRDTAAFRPPQELVVSSHNSSWNNAGGSFALQHKWGSNSYSRTFGFLSRYTRDFEFTTFDPPHPRSLIFGDNNQISFAGLGQHIQLAKGLNQFEAGFAIKQLRINYRQFLQRPEIVRPDLFSQSDQSGIIETYAAYTFRFQNRLKVKAGIRETYVQSLGQWLHSPRISATYLLQENLSIKAAAGHYNQYVREVNQLSPYATSESFWALADQHDISPSSATHGSLGLTWTSPTLTFNVEGYYKDLSGLINNTLRLNPDLTAEEKFVPKFIVGGGRAMGIDLSLSLRLKFYESWFSYSLSEVEHSFKDLNQGIPFNPEEDQRHQVKWTHSLQLGKFDVSLTYVYGSGRRYLVWTEGMTQALLRGELDRKRLKQEQLAFYQRIDMGVNYNLKLWRFPVTLGASVYNVLNRENLAFKQYVFALGENLDGNGLRETTIAGSNVPLLGITPNLSLRIYFQ